MPPQKDPAGTGAAPRARLEPVLLAATSGTAAMACLYLAFDVGVMPVLACRGDAHLVSAMRRMNARLDDNAPFGAFFLGVFVAGGLAARRLRRAGEEGPAQQVRAATALYGVSMVVTAAVNLPLNRRLAGAPTVDPVGLHQARRAYERPWRTANAVRTGLTLCALALLRRTVRPPEQRPGARRRSGPIPDREWGPRDGGRLWGGLLLSHRARPQDEDRER
ncbi:DUF1772 domain-containing protein [Streptomyces sp. NPDC015125]|uniref:anthrone oxygenase family protein n=1 Tax=Streptomyces sp. NPDC015125 TaxID=3364938 RepID=UPI0036FB864C